MKTTMVTNKNASNRTYKICGFDNGNYFAINLTFAELVSNNTDTDTELLYTLQENYCDEILDLKVKQSIVIKSKRDVEIGDDAVICRTS